MQRPWHGVCLLLFLALGIPGCGKRIGTTDPPAKIQLERLFEFYQAYAAKNKRPPPDEKAFKEFIRQLPKEERDAAGVGDDVDSFLVSPRDGQKFDIRYRLVIDVGGPTQAVAWEHTGKDGKRLVALSVGYVQEYSEEDFHALKK